MTWSKAPISVEVTAVDKDGMMKQGTAFAGWNKHVVVKLPTTREGVKPAKPSAERNQDHPMHVVESALAGAHVGTMPFKVLEMLFNHPLTDKGLAQFLKDWEKVKS